jgi:hypothetical protein
MTYQIKAVVVKGGETSTIQVAERHLSPREIIQIMEQKKLDLGYDYVMDIYMMQGWVAQPGWTGTAEVDAVAVMKALQTDLPGLVRR